MAGISLGGISGIDKKSWEYLWVRYADGEGTTAVAIVKKPVAIYDELIVTHRDLGNGGNRDLGEQWSHDRRRYSRGDSAVAG